MANKKSETPSEIWVATHTQILGAVAVKTAVIFQEDKYVFDEKAEERLQQNLVLHNICNDILRNESNSLITKILHPNTKTTETGDVSPPVLPPVS